MSWWKRIVWLVAVLVSGPTLVFVCIMLPVIIQEWDQVYWSHLALAKAEIGAIETAVVLFHKEYGSYPITLQELVHSTRNGGSGKQFLKRIAHDPWDGPFHYEVEHGASGESVKIWVVPDRKTQDKSGMTELSNRTNWREIGM
jgi:hypothetical protein